MSTNTKKEYDHERYEQNKTEMNERSKQYWDATEMSLIPK